MNEFRKDEFREKMRRVGEQIREEMQGRARVAINDRPNCYANRPHPNGSLVSGLVIVAVGLALLAAQTGFFSIGMVWHFWPMIFIAIGLGKLFGGSCNWVSSIFLILLGGLLMLHEFGRFNYGLWQLWPLFIISAGAELFWKAWTNPRAVVDDDGKPLSLASEVNATNIFGGSESRIASKDFRGGQVIAIFGGFEIDLSRAEIAGDSARIEATAVFGGGEIRVPPHWNVVVRGVGIFGGYSDETHHIPPEGGAPAKILYVEGAAIFGGVAVKN